MKTGEELREEGIETALSQAASAIISVAILRESKWKDAFTAEDVREHLSKRGLWYPPNMYGAAFNRAHRAGIIELSGYTIAKRPEAHGRLLRVWRGKR